MNIFITGSNGFVGKSLIKYLIRYNHSVFPIQRNALSHKHQLPDRNIDCIVHLAGHAHSTHKKGEDSYHTYRKVNVDYTLKIAEYARTLGIKRFIFLSSIKVNGELSTQPFNEQDTPHPLDAYGQTKLEAELLLKDFCAKYKIELVIIRPPLIYGPDVKANFNALIKLCKRPVPLPFGIINNRRSLISLENLNSFITLCCHHPLAANQIFLISDDEDVSTTTLVSTIRQGLGRPRWLLPIPASALRFFCKLIGKPSLAVRLCGNLQVDISKTKQLLDWKPPFTFKQGMEKTVQSYLGTKHHD